MEIDHYLHTEFLGPQAFLQDIFLAVPYVLRIHPHPEAQRIESQRFHQSRAIHLRTGSGIEFIAFLFHLRVPADVGALRKGRLRRLPTI